MKISIFCPNYIIFASIIAQNLNQKLHSFIIHRLNSLRTLINDPFTNQASQPSIIDLGFKEDDADYQQLLRQFL